MFEKQRQAVIDKYSAHWELLDPAHRLSHFDSVFNTALVIMERSPLLDVNPEEVFLVAYYHDLFTWSRNNHHFLSETFIRTTSCQIVREFAPTPEAIDRVALACREHRASWAGEFSGDLSRLMSAADRGVPSTAQSLLNRALFYAAAHNPGKTDEQIMELSVAHIREKYGRTGYAKIPLDHLEMFREEYEILYAEIDNL
jgi:hypothetical protein